mgnify:CR=1 FL=1
MAKLFPELKSAACVRRHPSNPVLSAKDIPYPADLIFNAGVVKRGGKYYMVFRNDYGYADERFAGTVSPRVTTVFTGSRDRSPWCARRMSATARSDGFMTRG